MKKLIIFFTLIMLTGVFSYSQNFVWAKQMSTTAWSEGASVVTDANGNVYSTGFFTGTADFDPGPSTYTLASTSGIYVSKLDAGGNFVWAQQMGGSPGGHAASITIDGLNNIYITGYFDGTVDFDPSPGGTYTLTSNGSHDIFICKLNSAGAFQWANKIGSATGDEGTGITSDASNNIYVTGYFQATPDFDPSATTYTVASNGSTDAFVTKFNSGGALQWAFAIGGTGQDYGKGIASTTSGSVCVTGYFVGTVDFLPGAGTITQSSFGGSNDVFVAKYSTARAYNWAVNLGGTSTDWGYGINVDALGNVYTTGIFYGTADFDPGAGFANLSAFSTNSDIFISKLDINGNFVWAKQIGGVSDDYGLSVDVDAIGNVYTTGYFQGPCDFDPSASIYTLTSGGGSTDIFISKLNSSGNFVWAKHLGGTGGGDGGRSVTLDANENIITTGYFGATGDFDPGAATYPLTASSIYDIFISKLSCTMPLPVTTTATNYTLCAGTAVTATINIPSPEPGVTYSWSPVGASGVGLSATTGTTTVLSFSATTSFSLVVTGTNPCGTDSTVVSTVLVHALPNVSAIATPTIVCLGNQLTLNGAGANTYTWSSGISNGTAFTPTTSITYTVTGTDINNCGNTTTINVAVINNPTITVTGANSRCLNQTNTLTANGAVTYTWMPGSVISNTINAQPVSNTVYTVAATGGNGCKDSTTFAVSLIFPQTPNICLVTTDSLSLNNIVYWDKTLYSSVDSFIIYRYDVTSSGYLHIGSVSKDSLSAFKDTAFSIGGPNGGNPLYSSWKYKLAIRDTCGNIGSKSPYHESLFVQESFQNFSWNAYAIEVGQSNPVSGYAFSRDDNNTGSWHVLVNTGGISTTDPNYSSFPNANWRVEALGFTCSPTMRLGNSGVETTIIRSKSNITNNRTTNNGHAAIGNTQISVYPNPVNDEVTLDFHLQKDKVMIEIYNVLGNLIMKESAQNIQNVKLNLKSLNSGVYTFEITIGIEKTVKKLIKE